MILFAALAITLGFHLALVAMVILYLNAVSERRDRP